MEEPIDTKDDYGKDILSIKKRIRHDIIGFLNTNKKVDIDFLIAKISLDTGLTDKVIIGIIDKMVAVGYVVVENNIISLKQEVV